MDILTQLSIQMRPTFTRCDVRCGEVQTLSDDRPEEIEFHKDFFCLCFANEKVLIPNFLTPTDLSISKQNEHAKLKTGARVMKKTWISTWENRIDELKHKVP